MIVIINGKEYVTELTNSGKEYIEVLKNDNTFTEKTEYVSERITRKNPCKFLVRGIGVTFEDKYDNKEYKRIYIDFI